MRKSDIQSAFRLIRVSPADFHLLGFKLDNRYYFDKCLPFGCSISCSIWEKFATFLEFAVHRTSSVGEVEHYLDDYFFGGKAGSNHCCSIMQSFFNICRNLAVPVAESKTEGPTTVIVFLGFELDSVLMQVRVPLDKIKALVGQILEILEHGRVTLKVMQSLIGSLNFMCRAIVPGRPFCRRLINATCGLTKPHHHLRISHGIRQDLHTWLTFFQSFNGISIFHDRFWSSSADICLFTDSAGGHGMGFGAYFQGKWVNGVWPDLWHQTGLTKDITVLEFFPILVSVCIWAVHLNNKKILFKCDNLSVVHILNTQTSKSEQIMVMVRALTLKCLQHNIVLKAEHIPGYTNNITDSLSRFQMARFRELAPNAEREPELMPTQLWSIFSREPDS